MAKRKQKQVKNESIQDTLGHRLDVIDGELNKLKESRKQIVRALKALENIKL